ncbi:MAG: NHLP leader peptide family RiPP precursor [Candidatus Brocadiaceae bacterium]|nr:NHLP leader peptide family RiPP precursor [Candidatus Brocadiaceae bacterium]
MSDTEKHQNPFGKIVEKAWKDEEFKRNLLNNPGSVLKANGVEIPDGVEVKIVENTDKVVYFTLPQKPVKEFSDDEPGKTAENEEQCALGDCGFMDEENWV